MDQTVTINLIAESWSYDNPRKQRQKVTTSREVYAQLRGIARTEWFEAGRNGHNPNVTFIISALDYQGESVVEYNGETLGVYRTYEGRNDRVELYCEKKGGLANG